MIGNEQSLPSFGSEFIYALKSKSVVSTEGVTSLQDTKSGTTLIDLSAALSETSGSAKVSRIAPRLSSSINFSYRSLTKARA